MTNEPLGETISIAAQEPEPVPTGKVSITMLVQISDSEILKESIVGADIVDADFDDEAGVLTLKAKVPNPRLLMMNDKDQFAWIQESVKHDGPVRTTRLTDVQSVRAKKETL